MVENALIEGEPAQLAIDVPTPIRQTIDRRARTGIGLRWDVLLALFSGHPRTAEPVYINGVTGDSSARPKPISSISFSASAWRIADSDESRSMRSTSVSAPRRAAGDDKHFGVGATGLTGNAAATVKFPVGFAHRRFGDGSHGFQAL